MGANVGKDLYVHYLDKYRIFHNRDRSPESLLRRQKEEGKDEYARLRRKLAERILSKRIYKTTELNRLYEETAKGNSGLDPDKFRAMWGGLMAELNA